MKVYSVKEELDNYIKNFPGVTNYHITKDEKSQTNWTSRSKLNIRLWVKKDTFDTENVTLRLMGEPDFKENIKILCKGLHNIVYDIYES